MSTIICKNKEGFYNKIKTLSVEDENIQIEFKQDDELIAFLKVDCDEFELSFTGRAKESSYVTEKIKRETGESVPIDEIINWFESKLS